MNFSDFIPVLGYPSHHPLVQSLLSQTGSKQMPVLKKGDTDAYIEIPEHGLYLVFTDVSAVDFNLPINNLEKKTLVLKNATARDGSQKGYSQFLDSLPEKLSFDLTRDQVHALLGSPSETNEFMPIDFYHRDGYRLITEYSDEEDRIMEISVEPYRKE